MRDTPNYSSYTDAELIDLLRDGNHTAYAEIYNRYHFSLLRFSLKKLNDICHAEDMVQELFVELWEKRAAIKKIENLSAYLITVVIRNIWDREKHEKVKLKYADSFAAHSLTFVNDTDYSVREKSFAQYINDQVNQLPKKMALVFHLNKNESLSYKEIAEKLNTSDNNVSKQVNNALKILKSKLAFLF